MDLIFKRYSNPYIFFDYCIENNKIDEFINQINQEENDKKMWEMYLHTLPYNEQTFEDWKKEIIKDDIENNINSTMTEKEYDATIKKSKDILKSFKPPKFEGR